MSAPASARPGFYRRSPARSARRGRRATWLVILVAALLLLSAVVFGDHGLLALQRERAQVQALQKAVDEETNQLRALEERIEAFEQPSSEILEEVGREEFLMRRPGEQVIHILEDVEAKQPADDQNR